MKLPFNVINWIEKNKDQLKPPVGNKVLFESKKILLLWQLRPLTKGMIFI